MMETNKIKCLKCGSFHIDVEDVGLTSNEHVFMCNDCGETRQIYFEEIDVEDIQPKTTEKYQKIKVLFSHSTTNFDTGITSESKIIECEYDFKSGKEDIESMLESNDGECHYDLLLIYDLATNEQIPIKWFMEWN